MGLREAVLDVAGILEQEAAARKGAGSEDVPRMLALMARMLRNACTASEGSTTYGQQSLSPDMQHLRMVEQAREEFRLAKRKGKLQEQGEIVSILCADGPLEGDSVPCDPQMPVGARTNLDGNIYRLGEDGKLHYEEPRTEQPGIITSI